VPWHSVAQPPRLLTILHAACQPPSHVGAGAFLQPTAAERVTLYSAAHAPQTAAAERSIALAPTSTAGRALPQNLNEGLDALEQNSVITQALGEQLTAKFLRVERMEWVEYRRHVSSWEVDHYLEFF
jgi:hypothetical protein